MTKKVSKKRQPGPPCPRCGSKDTERPRNYGRVHRNETRWWCMRCGALWEQASRGTV